MEKVGTNLKDFPKEILHDIFKFLSVKELFSLSLTCRVFNNVISSSSELCRNFLVFLSYRNRNKKWIGSRKYENFKIHLCGSEEVIGFLNIFREYGSNVKSLEIVENSINVDTLYSIFSLCPNINYVNFNHNFVNGTAEEEIFLPHLERLDYEGENLSIKKFFKCRELKTLSLSGTYGWPDIYLEKFLGKQTKLRKLMLRNFDRNGFMFISPMINRKIKFQLTTLSLVNIAYPTNPAIFKEFLELHKKSLKFLEIANIQCGMLRHFIDFPQIKTLKIISIGDLTDINIDNFYVQPMEQIEHLIIDSQNVSNFGTKFPNLITLETRKLKMKPIEIKQLKKLQKLTIIESKRISKFSHPNIREIRFISCKFNGKNILTNHQDSIETLSIKNCKNVEWLSSLLQYKHSKLKHFEIIGTKMSKELYTMAMNMKVDKLIFASNNSINRFEMFKNCCSSFFSIFTDCVCQAADD